VEQDDRTIKRRTRLMLGFEDFHCAAKIIAGIGVMHMIVKGRWAGLESQVMSAAVLLHDPAF
jgi:putative transposase